MGQKRVDRAAEKARRAAKQQRRARARAAKLEAALRRLGHETMLRRPAFAKAVEGLVGRLRTPPGEPPRLVTERDLMDTPEVHEMWQTRGALMMQLHGWTREEALVEIQQLCCHVQCAANYELSGRKAFWVSASLATLLRETALDIGGDLLRLPYASCAFVFDDDDTLSAMEQLVDDDPKLVRGPARIEVLTVYACPLEDQPGVRLIYLADRFDGEWPILLSRDIPTAGTRHLDEILDSHPEDSTDPMFRTEAMRRAVQLVINAILYTTSKEFVSEPRPPYRPGVGQSPRANLTGENVFYLPGKIVIDPTHAPEALETSDGARRARVIVGKRYWVRGHWRRPASSWQDQRLRWIRPYVKGPEMAAVIERHYALEARGHIAAPAEQGPGDGASDG